MRRFRPPTDAKARLVYVSDEARLAMPFVALGLVPEFGSSLAVPQLILNLSVSLCYLGAGLLDVAITDEMLDIDQLAYEYMGADRYPADDNTDNIRIIVRITPERIIARGL